MSGITIDALGSTINGTAELDQWTKFHFEGKVAGLSVREAAAIVTARPIPWNGIIEGGFSVDAVAGENIAKVQTDVAIAPAAEGPPITGQIDAGYDQAEGKLRLGNSYLETPATRVDVSGTLGETLQVRAKSTNLDDLLPALAMADANAPKELPIKLANGSAIFTGRVSGSLDDPRVAGQTSLTNASIEGHTFDRFSGDVEAGPPQCAPATRDDCARDDRGNGIGSACAAERRRRNHGGIDHPQRADRGVGQRGGHRCNDYGNSGCDDAFERHGETPQRRGHAPGGKTGRLRRATRSSTG